MSSTRASTVEPGAGLSIAATEAVDGLRLELSGELDLASAPQFERALARAMRAHPARLVLDLSDLSFLDSCGLRELLGAQGACEEAGCALTLIAGDPARRLFELTGVAASLPLAEHPAAGDARAV
jgi:anti-anti-sigma factor